MSRRISTASITPHVVATRNVVKEVVATRITTITVLNRKGTMTRGRDVARKLQKASNAFLIVMTALLCGCGEVLFHEFRSIGSRGWEKAESLCFSFDGGSLAGECAGYLLSVEARTDASYSYKDLVVRVDTFDGEAGALLSTDTLCCAVYADDGRREGATAGMLYQVSSGGILLPKGVCDTVVMCLSHIMEPDVLCGVYDVGIRLCPSSRGQRQSSGK